jgi:predicted PurR-regulated permease PerM
MPAATAGYRRRMPAARSPADPSRAAVYAGIAALVVALALLFGFAFTYVLLVFLGALLAILLRAPADWIARRTGLPEGIALALVGVTLLGLLGVAGYFFGTTLAAQTAELGARIPQAIQALLERLREQPWGRWLLEQANGGGKPEASKVVGGALVFAGSALEAVANTAIVVFFAIFLAAQPRLYVEGVVRLIPVRGRERAKEVLVEIGEVLQRWLVGQAVLMVCIAVFVGTGLLLLGAPLALPLALLAGLLNFIPYVGPILAAVPAVLVAFTDSPQMALYVALLCAGAQAVEGYVLEPLIQRKAVFLPPALILFSQMVLGLVGGPLGVIVATPFAAALLVAVRKLYVEQTLENR